MHYLKKSSISLFMVLLVITSIMVLSGCSVHTISMPVQSYELSKEPLDEPSDSERFKEDYVINIKYKDGSKDKFYLFNYNLEIKKGKKGSENEIDRQVYEDNQSASDTITWVLPPDKYDELNNHFMTYFDISLKNYEDMLNDDFYEDDDFNGN